MRKKLFMAVQGDLLELILQQRYLNEIMINVFQFRLDSATASVPEQDIVSNLTPDLVTAMQPLQSAAVSYELATLNNLSDPLFFATYSPATSGTLTCTDNTASLVAASFRLVRSTKITRDGGKRIGGLCDESFDSNTLDPTYTGYAAAFISFMESSHTYTDGGGNPYTLLPVIIGRDSVTGQYDLTRVNGISACLLSPTTSSQVSRKPKS